MLFSINMEIKEHKEKFDEIIKKYQLDSEIKAKEITDYVLLKQKINLKEFSEHFNMSQEEAQIFLSFINKGLEFKKENIDKK